MKYIDKQGNEYHFDETKISLEDFEYKVDNELEEFWIEYLHRLDEPALQKTVQRMSVKMNKCPTTGNVSFSTATSNDHTVKWVINGIEYSFDDFLEASGMSKEEQIEFKLRYS